MNVEVRTYGIYGVFCIIIMSNPSYYAIIPADVRYDSNLKANEKLLYGEITALTQSSGKCWANNQYFADLYGVSKTSVSKWIKNLINFGYIKSVIIYKEGSKQILNRYLTLITHPIEEKLNTPIEEKLKDNNTSVNNTSIIDFKGLLDFINKTQNRKGNGRFTVINKSTQSKFKTRLKDGYTKEVIITAIKNVANNKHHIEQGYKYSTPEFFSRSSTLDKYGFYKSEETTKKEDFENLENGGFSNF